MTDKHVGLNTAVAEADIYSRIAYYIKKLYLKSVKYNKIGNISKAMLLTDTNIVSVL